MLKRVLFGLVLTSAVIVGVGGVGWTQSGAVKLDEIVVQYPEGYTRVLAADIALLMGDATLREGVMEPLGAARHPLNGIRQAVELFRLEFQKLPWVAHGAGPNLSSFSVIHGAPFPQTFGALQGLKAAAGAPNSPYKHWELVEMDGIPVIFTGGVFGPIPIEWAYIPLANQLWFGTEVGLGGPANVARLKSSAERVIGRLTGRVGIFDEFIAAYATRGGAIAFVRHTDSAKDKPVELGEEAMSYAVFFEGTTARVRFEIRFASEGAAQTALSNLLAGKSGYLAQDLYRAELVDRKITGRVLDFEVRTDLRGVVGLLILTMPS
uniref:Uncharacterized protein n=2 Tax=Candidatus Bipolaricaulota TaxID=67810 RepID=H5SC85_9BACT|nr:hypothetical protein HGMM_F08F07C30 [uncultured Acetothermia bacterium]BAL59469.1 hypothetical protein HGMM_OP4C105 [Candidatus Acetothermum autotrophicum]